MEKASGGWRFSLRSCRRRASAREVGSAIVGVAAVFSRAARPTLQGERELAIRGVGGNNRGHILIRAHLLFMALSICVCVCVALDPKQHRR